MRAMVPPLIMRKKFSRKGWDCRLYRRQFRDYLWVI